VIFADLPATILQQPTQLEMLLPAVAGATREVLAWESPLDYPESVEQPAIPTLGLLVSLAAGVMAVISPCLLQLTAFYLPTLAGVSVAAASSGLSQSAQRRRVMSTALLFVLGFTIPYTLGGALMGGIGEQLARSGLLKENGPIVMGAGLVMIVMAGIVAYRARAPLVCKVPVPGRLQQSSRLPGMVPFVAGFAIATGCLACFGGAILGVLLVYAGILGSPMLGGLAMFVFSMGIAVPFLLAAFSVSRMAPLAMRMQSATPWIGLASAGIMLLFGVIMLSGNFHAVSGWLARTLPLA
jgi:cytochrome c-type biogenesis protein